ncbi:hypothetical protein VTJ49DRAFT_3323 [Mycothermus thermophilus]|uniref:RBR-type E3 ubiquitin transferase n=1 Tax=Humicola insolens TaxID=85995 RepID=A0ABR3V888_HUMIN
MLRDSETQSSTTATTSHYHHDGAPTLLLARDPGRGSPPSPCSSPTTARPPSLSTLDPVLFVWPNLTTTHRRVGSGDLVTRRKRPVSLAVMPTAAAPTTTAAAAARPSLQLTPRRPRPLDETLARTTITIITTATTKTGTALPELDEEVYAREVLLAPEGATEADIERELRERAAGVVEMLEVPEVDEREMGGNRSRSRSSSRRSGEHAGQDTPRADVAAPASPPPPPAIMGTGGQDERPGSSSGKARRPSVSFSAYDSYIAQLDPALGQSKFLVQEAGGGGGGGDVDSGMGVNRLTLSGPKRGGVKGFTRSLTARLKGGKRRGRRGVGSKAPMPCVCCRDEFPTDSPLLLTLPCGHRYCRDCLTIVIDQSTTDERKFPPRCCMQPIPGSTIQLVLPRDRQAHFVKTALQFSVPWPARLFCPRPSCGEFIPPTSTTTTTPNSKPKTRRTNPFETTCPTCHTRACTLCKRPAHPSGEDCPSDADSAAVLRLGELCGWRRCPRCRALVELREGCAHVTCRCRAQFCYICGAVWDEIVGCPNLCDGEEELARRRAEAAVREAEVERSERERERRREMERLGREEAEGRTRGSKEFKGLRERLEGEGRRFCKLEKRAGEGMRKRHARMRGEVVGRFEEVLERVRERHAKTEQCLEDRQVLAEMELRKGLEEKERRGRVRLRYMEEYCKGGVRGAHTAASSSSTVADGDAASDTNNLPPPRIVTPDDLARLEQQRREHDNLVARHRSQIEGLRSRQAKNMEALLERHAREVAELLARQAAALEDVAERCADEEEVAARVWEGRRERMMNRWRVEGELLRRDMEKKTGLEYGIMDVVEWPGEEGEGGQGEHERSDRSGEEESDKVDATAQDRGLVRDDQAMVAVA